MYWEESLKGVNLSRLPGETVEAQNDRIVLEFLEKQLEMVKKEKSKQSEMG